MKRIKLTKSQSDKLILLPETGMGYQMVKLTMNDGNVLLNKMVLDSTTLIIERDIDIDVNEIQNIELQK